MMRGLSSLLGDGTTRFGMQTVSTKRPKPEPVSRAKYTDEQILEMRRLHEQENVPPSRIARQFGMKGPKEAKRYLDYITRRDLVPARPKTA